MQKKIKRKKKIFIIVAIIIVAIFGIIGIIYYIKLDGRECLDCPYVSPLTTDDVLFTQKELISLGSNNGYKATIKLATANSSLIINGTIKLKYECVIEYCFRTTYPVYRNYCDWHYNVSGYKDFVFQENNEKIESFNINLDSSQGMYMVQNGISCDYYLTSASGNFKIYGDRMR